MRNKKKKIKEWAWATVRSDGRINDICEHAIKLCDYKKFVKSTIPNEKFRFIKVIITEV